MPGAKRPRNNSNNNSSNYKSKFSKRPEKMSDEEAAAYFAEFIRLHEQRRNRENIEKAIGKMYVTANKIKKRPKSPRSKSPKRIRK